MCGEEQVEAFERDGFVLVENAFSDAEVVHITAVARAIEQRGRVVDFPDASGRETQLALGVQVRDFPELGALVWADRLAGPARTLLDDEVLHLDTRVSLKRPGTGRWGWHQEYRYWQSRGLEHPRIVSAMVYLEPATVANGCLQLIGGSHLGGLLAHESIGGQQVVPDSTVAEAAAGAGPTYAEGPGGAVLFFHSKTLHSSAPNDSAQSRLALLVTYNAQSNGAVGEPPDQWSPTG